jgi:hypothetical protein
VQLSKDSGGLSVHQHSPLAGLLPLTLVKATTSCSSIAERRQIGLGYRWHCLDEYGLLFANIYIYLIIDEFFRFYPLNTHCALV